MTSGPTQNCTLPRQSGGTRRTGSSSVGLWVPSRRHTILAPSRRYVDPVVRVMIANDFTKRFKFPLPFGIDDMSNAANDAYAAWPERIYIIDESGRIAYRGGMGPFNYKPAEAREWLHRQTQANNCSTRQRPPRQQNDVDFARKSRRVMICV